MISLIRIFTVILAVFVSSYAFSEDKVVVIPLLKTSTPAGAAFNYTNGETDLVSTATTVQSVTVNVPSVGVLITNASGYLDLNNRADSWVRCGISKDSTSIGGTATILKNEDATNTKFVPIGLTRGFEILESGEVIIRLVCQENSSSDGSTDISDTVLTVMFFPNQL